MKYFKDMIPLVRPNLPPKEVLLPELEKIIYSGYITEGEKVKEFEKQFSMYIGNKFAVSTNSGTASLHLALILSGVNHNDEVISTPITAEPTNVVVLQTGAKIVWADVDYNTGNISPESIRKKITNKTKAIMVVHYAGIPANITRLQEISEVYSIPIIEDAAHAFGARYKNKKIGNHSPYVIFSFQAIKHMTTVDGGMLTVENITDYEKARLIRWFGIDKKISRDKNDIRVIGYKYHMNNINATVGIVQLQFIEKVISKYISNGKYYDNALKNISGVELCNYYKGSEPSYWLYTMKVDSRKEFIKKLDEFGIQTSVMHKRNDLHSIFSTSKTHLPNVDKFYSKMIHIPCGWWVGPQEREYIVDVIKKGW
jgi:dTDP-4-amino-4,6-dideoxygalactose transaminase